MKEYCIHFSEPVTFTYMEDKWSNKDNCFVPTETYETNTDFVFYNLTSAKKFINENIDKYVSSSIIKTWSNGDFENLGPIKLKGSNKLFVANTRQKKSNY